MVRLRPVLFVLGLLLVTLAAALGLPALADAAVGNPDWRAFALSGAATFFFGVLLCLGTWGGDQRLDLRQGFLLTVGGWLVLSVFGALPFLLSGLQIDLADAVFETVSGLTTTGSTVLVGLDGMPPGILLWRALLQWLGGIGIIAMAVLLLPFLQIGGMQLFRMESSDRSEKIMPRSATIIGGIAGVYLGLTMLCAVAYRLAGMTGFEAVTHAMTTVSTGGYSTSDASMGHFPGAAMSWIATVFMTAAGLPFVLFVRMLGRKRIPVWHDSQVRFFLKLLALVSLAIAAWLWGMKDIAPFDALTLAAFNVVSVVTTTGYATADYSAWGTFPVTTFFFLTMLGGCTGSTAGGLKILRLQVGLIGIREQLIGIVQPRRVIVRSYNGRPLPDGVIGSVLVLVLGFVATVAALALALALLGLDAVTALSGALTAVANVGPGLGKIIGPAGNFSSLPDPAKWLLSAGMLLGRLEFLTMLVVVTPRFWRD